MSLFQTPVPHRRKPSINAGSPLRSPRDKDATARLHSQVEVGDEQTFGLARTVAKLVRDVANLKRLRGGGTTQQGSGGDCPYA